MRGRGRLLVVVVVAVALGAACDPLKPPIPAEPGQTTNDSPSFVWTVPARPCGCEPTIKPRPAIAPYSGPRKTVLLAGESTMSFPATEIRKTLERLGLARGREIINVSKNGAWLGAGFDWMGRLRTYLRAYRPRVVVVSFVGPGPRFAEGVSQTNQIAALIRAYRATPVWIIQPTVKGPRRSRGSRWRHTPPGSTPCAA